jgi:hypothetical protein
MKIIGQIAVVLGLFALGLGFAYWQEQRCARRERERMKRHVDAL